MWLYFDKILFTETNGGLDMVYGPWFANTNLNCYKNKDVLKSSIWWVIFQKSKNPFAECCYIP